MTIQSRFPIPIILAGGMLLAATLSCNFETREDITATYEQYYSIDPPSLLQSIGQTGDTPFIAIENRPELPPLNQQIPVNWKQADYMLIVNAIFEDVWGETVDGWLLHTINFSLDCTKIDNGFQDANFQYFLNEKMQEKEIRVERSIYIDPRSKSVRALELTYFPRLTDWSSVELTQLQFSADVLAIAESNGGKEKRLAVHDVCDITLLLSPDSASYRGWHVRYSNSDVGNLFEIWVDPRTGEIHSP